MSFNNIEPVKLYPEPKKKNQHASLAGPFQGVPSETSSNDMPPKSTPRTPPSRRQNNPGPARGNVGGFGDIMAELNRGGPSTVPSPVTPSTAVPAILITPAADTTSASTTAMAPLRITPASSARSIIMPTTSVAPTSANTASASTTPASTTPASTTPARSAPTQAMAAANSSPARSAPTQAFASNTPATSNAASATPASAATSTIAPTATTTALSAATAPASSASTQAVVSTTPATSNAASATPASTATSTIAPTTTTTPASATIAPAPASSASAQATTSTTSPTSNAAGKRPATGRYSYLGTRSYSDRMKEVNETDVDDEAGADAIDDDDEDDVVIITERAERPILRPRSRRPAHTSATAPPQPVGTPATAPPAPSSTLAPAPSRTTDDSTDGFDFGSGQPLPVSSLSGAFATGPGTTLYNSTPSCAFDNVQRLPGLFSFQGQPQDDVFTSGTEQQAPVLGSWEDIQQIDPALLVDTGEPEPWELGVLGSFQGQDAATGTDIAPGFQPATSEAIDYWHEQFRATGTDFLPCNQATDDDALDDSIGEIMQNSDDQCRPLTQPACPVFEDDDDPDLTRQLFEECLRQDAQPDPQPVDQSATDLSDDMGVGDVQLNPGDRDMLSEVAPTDDFDEMYDLSPPSSPLSDPPDDLVDPREDQSTEMHDVQMPAGDAPGQPAPQGRQSYPSLDDDMVDAPNLADMAGAVADLGPAVRASPSPPDGDDSDSSSGDSDDEGDGADDPRKLFGRFDPFERERHHPHDPAGGDLPTPPPPGPPPPSPPPPSFPATRADLLDDVAALPVAEGVGEQHQAPSSGEPSAALLPQQAPDVDLADGVAASPIPEVAEEQHSELPSGDTPATPPPQPAAVADLVDDAAGSPVPEPTHWHNTESSPRETPVQRLLMQGKELRVKQLLAQAKTILAQFASLPQASILEGADYARQAYRLAEQLGVSEELKARCAYYEGFAEAVLCKEKFENGLPRPRSTYDDFRASGDNYLECFRRAKVANGGCKESEWAGEWLHAIARMTQSTTLLSRTRGKLKRLGRTKSERLSSLRQSITRHRELEEHLRIRSPSPENPRIAVPESCQNRELEEHPRIRSPSPEAPRTGLPGSFPEDA